MLRILITNAYSARNKGDAGIVAGMVDDLRSREVFRDAEFTISSAVGPGEADGFPGTVIDSFQSLKTRLSSSPLLQGLGFLFFLYPLARLWIACRRVIGIDLPVWSPLRRLLRAHDNAGLVIAAGGGYLYTRSKRRGNVVLLTVISNFHCAALLGKPVYLFSQSIGPFAGRAQEWLVQRSLRGVRIVFVREDDTRRRLERWRGRRRMPAVHPSADAAYLLTAAIPPRDLPPSPFGGIRVGLTVRAWFRDPEVQRHYEEVMGRFARWLSEEMNAAVFFVPQVTVITGGDDDRETARRVKAASGNSPDIHLIEDELDPAGIRGLCAEMDYFVGTRMHSNIYAMTMKVPALAVGYQPKTAGIMAQLGLERFVIPVEHLRLERLQEGFRRLQQERDAVVAALETGIPGLRQDARLASRLIAENFCGKPRHHKMERKP
jgi:colanic acid/amylovoran biosynthesis protein